MNNNEFTYIKEVAKQKSFSKASKALGISQPALSNYIKKLEDRTGVLLFDRSISPIEITEFGKAQRMLYQPQTDLMMLCQICRI